MSYERLWERLLEFLNGWAAVPPMPPRGNGTAPGSALRLLSRELVVQAYNRSGPKAQNVVCPEDPFAVEVHAERLMDGRPCAVCATVLDDDVGPVVAERAGRRRQLEIAAW